MLGGAYLCFEGAEKVAHVIGWSNGHEDHAAKKDVPEDPAHLEEEKAKGAIKTDFILSAEIMTISLAAIPESNFWMEAATLATVAVIITIAVYGSVALIVKMDDLGLAMANHGRLSPTRTFGRALVKAMPGFLRALTVVGTAAMLWVGGSIIVHGLEELGAVWPAHTIHGIAVAVSAKGPGDWHAAIEWVVTAAIDGVLGLTLGMILIPLGEKVVTPLWRKVFARS
jgi:predicted DNA repair protein MutK